MTRYLKAVANKKLPPITVTNNDVNTLSYGPYLDNFQKWHIFLENNFNDMWILYFLNDQTISVFLSFR